MADDKQDYRIIVLGEDNYVTWKWHMVMILKSKGLYEYVTSCPVKVEGPLGEDGQMVEEMNSDAYRATSLLASSLSQTNMQRVINCTNAYEIWTALESSFENKSSTERSMLLEKFTSYRIKRVSDISKALGDIQAKAAKLKSLGASIDDEFIISIILKALPDSLKSWKSTWKMINAENPNLNKLITSLMAEISEMKEPEDSAFLVRRFGKMGFKDRTPRPRGRNPTLQNRGHAQINRSMKDNDVCRRCNKRGHWARDCYAKINGNGNMQSNFANQQRGQDDAEDEHEIVFMAHMESKDIESDSWVADSGCSLHMTPHREWISNYAAFTQPKAVTLGDDRQIPALGSGDIKTPFGILKNVQLVPELSANLFSISAATKNGLKAVYDNNGLKIIKKNGVVLSGTREDGLYLLDMKIDASSRESKAKAFIARASIDTWHRRLCHVSIDVIKRMADQKVVDDLEIVSGKEETSICHGCVYGKQTKSSHKEKSTPRVGSSGTSLHFDTIGPFKEPSLGDCKYIILCKDEASSYRLIRLAVIKSDIPDLVKSMISQALLESGNKTLRIVTDNGSEFLNKILLSYTRSQGINHKLSVPYTPQQNGFIERDVRTIVEATRTLIAESKLPKGLWGEAVHTVVYALNRTLSSINRDKTPFELWFKRKPSVKNLHVFGEKAIVIYKDNQKSKWDPKGVEQYFVGYTDVTNTFRFYDMETGHVYSSCDAVFIGNSNQSMELVCGDDSHKITKVDESGASRKSSEQYYSGKDDQTLEWDNEFNFESNILSARNSSSEDEPLSTVAEVGGNIVSVRDEDAGPSSVAPVTEETVNPQTKHKYVRRDHIKDPSERLKPSDIHPGHILDTTLRPKEPPYHAKLASLESENDPQNYKEAMKRKDHTLWHKAMTEEIESLHKNKVWILVDRPSGNIVTNKWVFKIKRNPQGQIERYKARLVARGFTQKYGVDYLETYAPVANMVSIRMLFSYAAMNNLEMAQFDIKTAFLYGELEEEVYMEQPEGFEDGNNKVCLLKRSLYGLKQSPRQWNLKFSNFLKEMNLTVSEHDSCIFYRKKPFLIIAIYVDDGIVFADSKSEVDKILDQLRSRFEVHLVKSSAFLGFQFHRHEDKTISLHQTNYISMILKKFNMEESRPADSPISLSIDNAKAGEEKELNPNTPYREAIGSLMYAAVTTRIDIAHAVNKASRRVASPTVDDWADVKRIFRYLKGKENYSLRYGNTVDHRLSVYCDSDFAGDTSTSRSTTGSVFMYGGAPIQWKSQRQSLVTLSSTEAEFVSICSAVKETIWIRKLGLELSIIDARPSKLYCDNQSAIRIASNEKSVQRTRHMSVQASYPREQIEKGEIEIHHVKSEYQLADMLTKPTTIKKFVINSSKLMSIFIQILFAIAYILFITIPAIGYLFEQVNPLIFIPTENYVEIGITTLDIDLTYKNPCEAIPTNNDGRNEANLISPEDLRIYQQVRKDCQNTYEQHWTTRVHELVMYMSSKDKTQLLRRKRIIPFLVPILVIGGPLLIIAIITNLISTMIGEIVPWGDGYRVKELKAQSEIDKERIAQLELKQNTTAQILQGVEDSLDSLTKKVYENTNRIQHLSELMPRVMWEGSYIQNCILEAGAKLEFIIIEAHKGRAATQQMASLYNYTEFKSIPSEDTFLLEVTRKSNATVNFKIAIRNRSKDTTVYQAYAFNYYENLTGTPYQMVYRGKDYLIHNTTSDCMKGIDEPTDKGVQEECIHVGYRDAKLKKWVRARTNDDIQTEPKVKRAILHNYISCYEYNITINDDEYACPAFPFKLPITTSFHTFGHNHTAVTISKTWGGPQLKMIDTSLPSQLMPIQTNDQQTLISSLEKLRELQAKLIKSDVHPLSIQSENYSLISLVVILMGLASITVMQLLCKAYKTYSEFSAKRKSDYEKVKGRETDKTREKEKGAELNKLYNERYREEVNIQSDSTELTEI